MMNMARILLVEDDASLAAQLRQLIQSDGHDVDAAHTVSDARATLTKSQFDLIVLDWELPDGSGLSLCNELRGTGSEAGILMLTGRTHVDDRIAGLDTGADDYLTKPFHAKELKARVRSLLERSSRGFHGDILRAGELALNTKEHRATIGGAELDLTQKEFSLLEFFMRHRERAWSLDELLSHVWTADDDVAPDTVRTHLKNLRHKLDSASGKEFVENVHGFGYRFVS
jgi:DNA-binding response OmpR family regulator